MAHILYDFFLKASEIGGIQARTRLSILSKMTSIEAKSVPDTEDRIKAMEGHFNTVVKEFGKNIGESNTVVVDTDKNLVNKLRKHMMVFADLTSTRAMYSDDLIATARRITESLVEAIDVERASIWLFNDENTAIECVDLFVRSKKDHTSGIALKASDFPNYFKTVATQRTLAATNAHTHPGTAEFSEVYLKPLGINAMLDVPIYAHGKMIGVVCHEHTGDFRKWTTDEESFAYVLGNIIGMTIEKLEPKEVLV